MRARAFYSKLGFSRRARHAASLFIRGLLGSRQVGRGRRRVALGCSASTNTSWFPKIILKREDRERRKNKSISFPILFGVGCRCVAEPTHALQGERTTEMSLSSAGSAAMKVDIVAMLAMVARSMFRESIAMKVW